MTEVLRAPAAVCRCRHPGCVSRAGDLGHRAAAVLRPGLLLLLVAASRLGLLFQTADGGVVDLRHHQSVGRIGTGGERRRHHPVLADRCRRHAIGRELYDERSGVWAGISFACMPVVGFNSLFVSTDAPLMFFWALDDPAVHQGTGDGRWRWWLGTGLVAGLGLLSKYSMGVLAVGLLAWLLADRAQRHWLADVRLWAGLLVAVLVVAPNLWWNAQNDFISFRHTAEISQLDRDLFHPERLLEFIAAQFGVFGPVFMGLFLWKAFRRRVTARIGTG